MASFRATETSYLNFLSADLIAINDKFAVEFLQDAAGTHHLQYSYYQGDEAVNPKSEFVVRQGFQYEPIEDRTFGVVDILCRVTFWCLLRCYFRNADPFTAVGTGDISSSTTLMIVTFSTNGSGGGEGSEDGSEGGSGGGSNNGPGDYGSNGSNGSNGGSGNYLYMRKNRRTACLIREP
ncbi:hypothetical protein LXG23DRAFT_37969 [Yarrowia lipolytica]|nr:hypothetical protein BKA91DRAFT_131010 [Yarrowia lipolytica]KAJ8053837.1 hypothetical protein LXG23DRAFT_37969 [Yarrowia lipolytica]RMI96283.1 hypothetical protein BD777DRAFT_137004 [Yarrowia lipolytica]